MWIRQAAELLARYEQAREEYPTFESYFPEIARYLQVNGTKLADDARKSDAELDARRPNVVSIVPQSGDGAVDPATSKLVITFDRPMQPGYSLMDLGQEEGSFPEVTGKPLYDESRQVLTVPVRLRPARRYRFALNNDHGGSFRSQDGTPLARVDVWFVTRSD